jgi:hypothetical protein
LLNSISSPNLKIKEKEGLAYSKFFEDFEEMEETREMESF